MKTNLDLADGLLLLLLGTIWGGSFFFNAVAVASLHPLLVVFLRVGIAACILCIVIIIRKEVIKPSFEILGSFLVMGCLNNAIPFMCIVWGQQHISAGLASVLNATVPLFTVLLATWLLHDEKVTANKVLGVTLGLLGVLLMMSKDLIDGKSASVLGQALVACAAISYAFAGIFGRRFKRMGITPLMTATGQVTGSSLLLLPVIVFYTPAQSIAGAPLTAWLSVVGLATVCTAFAYLLFFKILSSSGATNLSLVTFIVPISAILLGGAFLDEVISATQWVGIAIIACSLLLIDGRLIDKIRLR